MEAHFRCYQTGPGRGRRPIDRGQFYRQAGMTGHEQIRYFAAGARRERGRRGRLSAEAGDLGGGRPSVARPSTAMSPCCGRFAGPAPVAIASGSSRQSVLPVMERARAGGRRRGGRGGRRPRKALASTCSFAAPAAGPPAGRLYRGRGLGRRSRSGAGGEDEGHAGRR